MAELFQAGDFTLHSGERSRWKIDCEALSEGEIRLLAALLIDLLPAFGAVEGIPRGGLRLAAALAPYATGGPLLIVDDVYTTGGSLEAHRAGREAIGAVLFARRPVTQSWIFPLFTLRPPQLPVPGEPPMPDDQKPEGCTCTDRRVTEHPMTHAAACPIFRKWFQRSWDRRDPFPAGGADPRRAHGDREGEDGC